MKVALTIPTGRPRVKKVVKSFLDNWELYGRDPKELSVYLAIDTQFQNTSEDNFHLESPLESKLGNVEYIGSDERDHLAEEVMTRCNVTPKIVDTLFRGRGYSKQRNCALISAIKDGNDIAICVDDDESAVTPIETSNGRLDWQDLDFFGPHLYALQTGCDITRGPYLGYQSPIPSDFEKDIPEEIRKKLGEALGWGNDVINTNSFFNLMTQIRSLTQDELKQIHGAPKIIENGPYGKHIYAGNMGINLKSVVEKEVPVFYTPPEARGEDTIFALQLGNLNVGEVNSYIFHDPFNMYPRVFEGEYPPELAPIPIDNKTSERFTNALLGWLKYAPILVAMTSTNNEQCDERLNNMLNQIGEPTTQLATLLNQPELANSHDILRQYIQRVEKDYSGLIYAQNEWKTKILPSLR